KRGLSKRRTMATFLGILLLLIAVIGGSYAYSASVSISHIQATATARAAPTATVQTAIGNYNASVATHGVMFGFDAGHTRSNPYERVLNVTNVSRLGLKWATPTGSAISSSPVVANGVVYVGSDDHKLYAFDAATGGQRWVSAPTGNALSSP